MVSIRGPGRPSPRPTWQEVGWRLRRGDPGSGRTDSQGPPPDLGGLRTAPSARRSQVKERPRGGRGAHYAERPAARTCT
ncbi:hypothetical protein NDU88_001534 [Pleurodeles waltl]|uniref:Uncharacterized protein n=1 Tax=Pleurodeles waltl TaxID=8319 RepID=A0AAV7T0T7_PLEWA|nr:hypothetical protein NDU88_001534 [Pleurodeles waltl]